MPKLLCVVIDSLRSDSLDCAHTRCFNRIMQDGFCIRQLQPMRPALALPTLVSLLTSTPAENHGVLTNSGNHNGNHNAASLFSLLRYRHQTLSAFFSADRLNLLFPQNTLHTAVMIHSQDIRNVDRELTAQAASHLQREKPDCCFLQLQGVDIAGRHFGFHSEPFLESVELADQALGELIEHLALVGLQEEYVLMIMSSADGSQAPAGKGQCIEAQLPLIFCGPGIQQGRVLDTAVSILDLAPTMADILGLAAHPDWQGRVIEEIFDRPCLEVVRQQRGTRWLNSQSLKLEA